MSVQQIAPQGQKPKRTRSFWIRLVIGIIALLCLIAGGLVWILSIGRVLAGDWSTILPIVFIVLGVAFALLMWLFPFSPVDTRESVERSFSISLTQVSQLPPTASPPQHRQAEPPQSAWNVPYPRNPFFTGREDLLKQLHSHLAQTTIAALTQPPAITGLGGIGKTQIVLEYAHRYRDEYNYVLWVNATGQETLIEGFVSIARLIGLPVKDEQDQRIIVEATKQWLATSEHWLLILDNADDLEVASDFLPTTGKGHLLLTSRAGATGSMAQNFPVEKMNEHEGAFFLLRRAKILTTADASLTQVSRTDQILATDIVKELDGFPLALDQAGAYIEETPSTLDTYLKSYRRRHLELLGERGSDRYHHVPVAATWSLNFEQVKRLDPAAADLLRFLTFLAPDAIPEDLIVAGASELGPQFEMMATDETRLDQPIKTLSHFSLVQRNLDQHLLVIHRLVQTILKARMAEETRCQWAERTVRALDQAFPSVEATTWPQCEQYLPHAQRGIMLIETYSFAFTEAAHLLNQVAHYLYERAQYKEAEPLYQCALAINEQVIGENHPDTAGVLNNLAVLYRHQGRYEEAEPLYQRALTIYEQVLGSNHPDTATSLQNLAGLYDDQGRYEEAEPLYQRALAIYEQLSDSNHLDMASTLNNLALLYNHQGKYADSESFSQRALAIREQELGHNHPNVAISLNNLAGLYYEQGKYAEAEPLYQRALAINEQLMGENHSDTANTLNNLGLFYYSQGKHEQAESFYQRALAINEQILGPNHPNTAGSLHNLGLLYHSQGKYEQAALFYPRALAIMEKAVGSNHPNTKTVHAHYASLLESIRHKKK